MSDGIRDGRTASAEADGRGRRDARIPAAGITAVVLACLGCVVASNPWHTDKDVTFDEGLVGKWMKVGPDGKAEKGEPIQFAKAPGGRHYVFVKESAGKKGAAKSDPDETATLVTIGKVTCLAMPLGNRDPKAGKEQAHLLMLAKRDGDRLVLTMMNDAWFVERINAGKFPLKTEVKKGGAGRKDSEVVVDASTADLRKLVEEHGEELFRGGEALNLQRVK